MNESDNQTDVVQSIMLTDTDGNDIEFDIMDKFNYQGGVHYVLLPADEIGTDTEYVLLRETHDAETGELALEGLESAELLESVFEIYKQRHVTDD